MNDQIAIGSVRTTHGVRGYLKVRSFSGEYSHFFNLKSITLRKDSTDRKFEIESVKPNGNQILMKLKGIDTPEQGKLFSSWEIWVPREEAAPLDAGEFYHADLVGCHLFLSDKKVGTVVSVIEGGGGELLEVKTEDNTAKLIPFNKVFIGPIDIKEKKIELLEGWILD